jgi:hypothetical protein
MWPVAMAPVGKKKGTEGGVVVATLCEGDHLACQESGSLESVGM